MITIERVAWEDPRAVALRAAMDDDMHARYGVGDGTEDPAKIRRDINQKSKC